MFARTLTFKKNIDSEFLIFLQLGSWFNSECMLGGSWLSSNIDLKLGKKYILWVNFILKSCCEYKLAYSFSL